MTQPPILQPPKININTHTTTYHGPHPQAPEEEVPRHSRSARAHSASCDARACFSCWGARAQYSKKAGSSCGVARKTTPMLMNGSLEWASEKLKKLFVAWYRKKATPTLMNGSIEWPGQNGHQSSSQKAARKKLLAKICLQKAAPKRWARQCGEIEYHCPEKHNRDMLASHGKEIENRKGQLK